MDICLLKAGKLRESRSLYYGLPGPMTAAIGTADNRLHVVELLFILPDLQGMHRYAYCMRLQLFLWKDFFQCYSCPNNSRSCEYAPGGNSSPAIPNPIRYEKSASWFACNFTIKSVSSTSI